MDELDTQNKYLVGAQGDKIVIMRPPREAISTDDALLLAAWIVAITCEEEKFSRILKALQD